MKVSRFNLIPLAWLLLTAGLSAAKPWEVWENCTLVESKYRDGDSFYVRKDGGRYTYILRLYYVDTPETDTRIPERVKEQADYWGISEKEAMKLGETAAIFSEKILANPFTVFTRKEDARGASKKNRYYCMIRSADGETFLADALVKAGLARIYGSTPGDPPKEVPAATRFKLRLKGSEKEAKKNRAGGWGTGETVPVAPAAPAFEPGPLTLKKALSVYSLKPPFSRIGSVRSGATIELLKEEVDGMVRIRFKAGANKTYEAQCRRADL